MITHPQGVPLLAGEERQKLCMRVVYAWCLLDALRDQPRNPGHSLVMTEVVMQGINERPEILQYQEDCCDFDAGLR